MAVTSRTSAGSTTGGMRPCTTCERTLSASFSLLNCSRLMNPLPYRARMSSFGEVRPYHWASSAIRRMAASRPPQATTHA